MWEHEWISATDDEVYVWQIWQRSAVKAVRRSGNGVTHYQFIYQAAAVLCGRFFAVDLWYVSFFFQRYRKNVGAESEIFKLAVSDNCKMEQF